MCQVRLLSARDGGDGRGGREVWEGGRGAAAARARGLGCKVVLKMQVVPLYPLLQAPGCGASCEIAADMVQQ